MAQDNVRLPLQTVAAVLLACAAMMSLDLPEIAWGAFSALFVVRASVEGTVGEAAARILGAFIGVALGVSLVLLTGAVGAAAPWRIGAGVGLAAYLSMRWPMLSYSLVTATIITVTPDSDILGGAAQKALAIFIGSACGILAAVAVLPLSARRSVRINLAASIEAYGELLVEWASALREARQRPHLYGKPFMEQPRWRARDMASQACAFPMDMLFPHATAYRLHERIERLWRTAPLMERAGGVVLSDQVCSRLGPALDDVAAAAKQQIDDLAQALRDKGSVPGPPPTGAPFKRLDDLIEDAMRSGVFDPAERSAVEVIRWAWHEVTRELDELAEYLGGGKAL